MIAICGNTIGRKPGGVVLSVQERRSPQGGEADSTIISKIYKSKGGNGTYAVTTGYKKLNVKFIVKMFQWLSAKWWMMDRLDVKDLGGS